VKIRLTEFITFDGDGDLQNFWDYRDAKAAMLSWSTTLEAAYFAHLQATFPTAIVEVTTPIIFDGTVGPDELRVLLIWDKASPAGDGGTGFMDVTEESRAMCYEVRCDAWAAWVSQHPPDDPDA
jgi:hypothetical protein